MTPINVEKSENHKFLKWNLFSPETLFIVTRMDAGTGLTLGLGKMTLIDAMNLANYEKRHVVVNLVTNVITLTKCGVLFDNRQNLRTDN